MIMTDTPSQLTSPVNMLLIQQLEKLLQQAKDGKVLVCNIKPTINLAVLHNLIS